MTHALVLLFPLLSNRNQGKIAIQSRRQSMGHQFQGLVVYQGRLFHHLLLLLLLLLLAGGYGKIQQCIE
jgi:hypothetical protein